MPAILSGVIGGVSSCRMAAGGEVGGLGGQKLLMGAVLRSSGEETLGNEGRLSGLRCLQSLLAAHRSFESAQAMKLFQCFFLAALMVVT